MMGSYYWLKGRVCEVSGRRSLTTFCAKGRGTKRIHTAWRAEMTEDVEKTEEKKVQRNIFGTFWQLHFTTKATPLCTWKVSAARRD